MAILEITSRQRSALRAAAHSLHPVVQIGDRGLSEAVMAEIDRSLDAHELIKVKVASNDRQERDAMLSMVCDTLNCAPVHHLGRTLILYRPQATQAADDIMATRAVRKPSEPYTPKKLAAAGKVRTRRAPAQRKQRRPGALGSTSQPQQPWSADGDHNIPVRRGGSALTLRAGLRRTARSGSRHRK